MSKRHVQSVKNRLDKMGLMDMVVRGRDNRSCVSPKHDPEVVDRNKKPKRVSC